MYVLGIPSPQVRKTFSTKKRFYHKSEFKEFAREFKGRKYVADDGMSIYILSDNQFPDAFETYQLLGAYGIGFIETDKGNFLLLGYTSDKTESELTAFKKVAGSICFTATGFIKEEQTRTTTSIADAEIETDVIAKQIGKAKISSSSCAALKVKFYEEQQRQILQKKEMLTYLANNRVDARKQTDMQKAYGKYDPFAAFILMRLEAEYRICEITESLNKNLYKKQGEAGKAIVKKNCLSTKVVELKKTESEAAALKRTHRANSNQLNIEQQRLMRKIQEIIRKNKCN